MPIASTCPSTPSRRSGTARPASTRCSTTTRQPALPDQRPELRPLQNLRYQGSDPEHRLDHARGRRRTQLSRHVRRDYSDDPARLGWLLFAVDQGGCIRSDGVNINGGSSMPSSKARQVAQGARAASPWPSGDKRRDRHLRQVLRPWRGASRAGWRLGRSHRSAAGSRAACLTR